jgi:hypothetical protein
MKIIGFLLMLVGFIGAGLFALLGGVSGVSVLGLTIFFAAIFIAGIIIRGVGELSASLKQIEKKITDK